MVCLSCLCACYDLHLVLWPSSSDAGEVDLPLVCFQVLADVLSKLTIYAAYLLYSALTRGLTLYDSFPRCSAPTHLLPCLFLSRTDAHGEGYFPPRLSCVCLRLTQSINYVPLQVIRLHKSILLIVQYKYLKSCSKDFILKNLILCTRSCGTAFIPQHSWLLQFRQTEICLVEMICTKLYQLWRGILEGPALKYFYMIHRGGLSCVCACACLGACVSCVFLRACVCVQGYVFLFLCVRVSCVRVYVGVRACMCVHVCVHK